MSVWWLDALLHLVVGYPVYQILGTIRHELSHAVAYWLSGYGVKDLHLLPFRDKNGTFYWGRAIPDPRPGARHTIHMHLAPYYTNIALLGMWAIFAVLVERQRAVLAALNRLEYNLLLGFTVLLLVSPLVDTLYNLYKFVRFDRGDFARAWEFHKLH